MKSKKNPFHNAFQGLKWFALSQWNFKIHTIATVIVIGLSIVLQIAVSEWIAICFAIALVWVAELLNTALEFALDKLHPEHDEIIGKAKDVAAAAVLIASIAALIVGAMIFAPKIIMFF
jgi:diacylglycerol kinase